MLGRTCVRGVIRLPPQAHRWTSGWRRGRHSGCHRAAVSQVAPRLGRRLPTSPPVHTSRRPVNSPRVPGPAARNASQRSARAITRVLSRRQRTAAASKSSPVSCTRPPFSSWHHISCIWRRQNHQRVRRHPIITRHRRRRSPGRRTSRWRTRPSAHQSTQVTSHTPNGPGAPAAPQAYGSPSRRPPPPVSARPRRARLNPAASRRSRGAAGITVPPADHAKLGRPAQPSQSRRQLTRSSGDFGYGKMPTPTALHPLIQRSGAS